MNVSEKLTFRVVLKNVYVAVGIAYEHEKLLAMRHKICSNDFHVRSAFSEDGHLVWLVLNWGVNYSRIRT